MFKFKKFAAILAIVPVVALSSTAFAGSPGQLAGGDNYVVKNVTQGGAYANSVSATCNEKVQYSMQLSNTQFGALDNVTLKVTLPSAGGVSTATATTDLGGQSGTTDTASVNLSSGANQTLVNGTTNLYDGNGSVIKNLPNTVANGGVNIGTIEGSTTKFVNFQAKLDCPETPEEPSVLCSALVAEYIGSANVPAKIKFTAKGSVTGDASINGYLFNFGDDETADGADATVEHTYAKAGDYTATAQVKSTLGTTDVSDSCSVAITVTEDQPPVVTPPTSTTTTPTSLPSTGPAEMVAGLFGVSSLGYGIRTWLMSRRNLFDALNQ